MGFPASPLPTFKQNAEELEFIAWVQRQIPSRSSPHFPLYCQRYVGRLAPFVQLIARYLFPFRAGLHPHHISSIPVERWFVAHNGRFWAHRRRNNHVRVAFSPVLRDVARYVPDGTVVCLRENDLPETLANTSAVFGFCRRPGYFDILMSYGIPHALPAMPPWEKRAPVLVWGGTGYTELRLRAAEFSKRRPDLLRAWCIDAHMRAKGCQPTIAAAGGMPFARQLTDFRYLLHIDGICGSERLERQLASGSLVFTFDGMDELWYTPLLRANITHVSLPRKDWEAVLPRLLETVRTEDAHFRKVAENGQRLGQYIDHAGTRCYTSLLLQAYASLWHNRSFPVPHDFEPI
eukprot:TRINITY_DN97025_c0_g1_i1.p1 TRINITY_DN97025_c0_g1~~TRINITY_DN97025_c0_g1_i1.p1  ORF type:complete len:392 (+),score=42.25 TRINITY_DN97025_c0_g1_i1:133-1176(+)